MYSFPSFLPLLHVTQSFKYHIMLQHRKSLLFFFYCFIDNLQTKTATKICAQTTWLKTHKKGSTTRPNHPQKTSWLTEYGRTLQKGPSMSIRLWSELCGIQNVSIWCTAMLWQGGQPQGNLNEMNNKCTRTHTHTHTHTHVSPKKPKKKIKIKTKTKQREKYSYALRHPLNTTRSMWHVPQMLFPKNK